jgi:hypothetical protein
VTRWCDQRGLARGSVITIEQCWELAKRWYPGRQDLEWRRKTQEEVEEVFRAVGLVGSFWELPSAD